MKKTATIHWVLWLAILAGYILAFYMRKEPITNNALAAYIYVGVILILGKPKDLLN